MNAIWRDPDEESLDLYPGLVVHDGRVTGSITTGRSRLPLWAFAGVVACHGWGEAERGWEPSQYDWTPEKHDGFIYNLLEQRGEFARLLCILADVERDESERDERQSAEHFAMVKHDDNCCSCGLPSEPPWFAHPPSVKRVRDQLQRCIDVLSPESMASWREQMGSLFGLVPADG